MTVYYLCLIRVHETQFEVGNDVVLQTLVFRSKRLARRLLSLLIAGLEGSRRLMSALKRVYDFASHASWKVEANCWAVNDAESGNVHLNLLTGEILINGKPPGRLPGSYESNALFKTLFGGSRLDVTAGAGHDERGMRFKTQSTIEGYRVFLNLVKSRRGETGDLKAVAFDFHHRTLRILSGGEVRSFNCLTADNLDRLHKIAGLTPKRILKHDKKKEKEGETGKKTSRIEPSRKNADREAKRTTEKKEASKSQVEIVAGWNHELSPLSQHPDLVNAVELPRFPDWSFGNRHLMERFSIRASAYYNCSLDADDQDIEYDYWQDREFDGKRSDDVLSAVCSVLTKPEPRMTFKPGDALEKLKKVFGSKTVRDPHENGIWLLRGLMAGGLLWFAFGRKRWTVDFGLDPDRKPSTRLAVPYRAKDTPSSSDFCNPDIQILLTCLCYYYGGVPDDDLLLSLQQLSKSEAAAMSGSPMDTEVDVDGFIPVESRHRITPYKTQFIKSPVQFLKVLMTSIRYNGRSIDKTHVGRMLNGVVLGEEDFEPRVKRKAEEQLGRDSEM
ncbi:very large low complexity protein [Ophiocordyceps camponoti-floridani]|uniref:ubiquitinyl hydrolase 1 n=1 Tax=Ophiocordyceps camponoti-floridani TaxID=2030778 RepID=A0A8H4Q0J1_9HYPO|nr:very large low complexity protein [Ophiocordyceps camponoti-floridani]